MKLMVKDRNFYIQLAMIAIPIAAQNLVNFGVSMADTIMLGMLGEVQLSATANANQLGFVFTLLTFGVGSGSNVMIAQYWGKGELEPIYRVLTVMYRLLLVGSLLFSILALGFPRLVMSAFTTDEAVIATGVEYLKIIGFTYVLTAITNSTIIVLRAVSEVRVTLAVYLTSLVTNVVFNYLLIFGKFGFPALGVRGAAMATCLARLVEFVVLMVYMTRFEKHIHYKLRYFFMRRVNYFRRFMDTALPVIFNEFLWSFGSAMIAVIMGRMGREFTAANSICTVLSQLVTIMIYGVGNAAAVFIGNTVGAGKYDLAKQYARTFMGLSILMGLVSASIVLLLKNPLLSLYNVPELTQLYASQIMTVYAVVVVFQSINMLLLIGVLRGGGDTRFVLVADVLFMWALSIPLGFLVGPKLRWPVWVVYAIIKSDEIIKSFITIIRMVGGKWIRNVTGS